MNLPPIAIKIAFAILAMVLCFFAVDQLFADVSTGVQFLCVGVLGASLAAIILP